MNSTKIKELKETWLRLGVLLSELTGEKMATEKMATCKPKVARIEEKVFKALKESGSPLNCLQLSLMTGCSKKQVSDSLSKTKRRSIVRLGKGTYQYKNGMSHAN